MHKKSLGKIQLGRQGITDNFISSLENHFKNFENVKISILKSAGHDKEGVKEYSEKILENLGKNYTAKIVGFTIFVKKWRKVRR